jgi:hypothetical protein
MRRLGSRMRHYGVDAARVHFRGPVIAGKDLMEV